MWLDCVNLSYAFIGKGEGRLLVIWKTGCKTRKYIG